MEEMIRQAFVQVEDVFYPRVLAGHYLLKGPDGNVISPLRWESTVEPGIEIIMVMPMPHPFYAGKPKPNLGSKKVKGNARSREKLESRNKEPSLLASFFLGH